MALTASDVVEVIAETIHESLLVLDAGFRVQTANQTFYRTFHVEPGETLGHPLFELGDGQWDIPSLRKLLEETLRSNTRLAGFALDQEFPCIGFRHLLINASTVRANDEAPRILLAIEDATEKRRAEKDLHRTESTLRALLDSAAQGVLAVNPDGKISLANRMTERIFGYGPGELTGQSLNTLVLPESRARHIGRDLAGCRKDGSHFPIEISLSFIDTPDGRLGVAFISDISQRKQMEEALLNQQSQIERILATAPGAICAYRLRSDGTACFPYVSPGFHKMLPELPDLTNDASPLFAMMHPEDAARVRASVAESARRMEPWRDDFRILTPTRGTLWFEGYSVPTREPDGSVYWYGFLTEVTKRKKAEAMAEKSRRELGILTSRLIAANEDQSKHLARELHDVFSQKLAVLAMDVSALEKQFPADLTKSGSPVSAELRKLGDGIRSLAAGLHQMSRQLHPSILQDLGLAAALRDECRMFSEIQGIPVRFESAKIPKLLPEAVALCLYRVAQETLRNIAKHAGAREVRFRLAATKSEICLSVQDIGDGFELAKARRKRGLGLISMEERVRMVNGVFKIESKPGQGTRVEVRVPLRGEK